MPSQWEYQVGPCVGMEMGDQLWMSRYCTLFLVPLLGLERHSNPNTEPACAMLACPTWLAPGDVLMQQDACLCTAFLSCLSRPCSWRRIIAFHAHCLEHRYCADYSTLLAPIVVVAPLQGLYTAVPERPTSQLTGCYVRRRYIMLRLGELYNVDFCLDPKPVQGDWNGTGGHCNFSTTATRTAPNGFNVIKEHCEKLRKRHALHMAAYGEGELPSHMHSRDCCV